MATSAPFVVYRFWTEYPVDKATGQPKAIDWVEYGPIGAPDRVRNTDKVSRILNVRDVPLDTNPAAGLAKVRADYIGTLYRAWKDGQELPETGTPLAAWNGVTKEQADILRTKGFKTVEDVAGMTDTHIQNVPLPGLRALIEGAKRFMTAADSTRVAAELAQRDEELARLRADAEESRKQQDEMARMLAELLAEKRSRVTEEASEETAKRKPGRPRTESRAAA